MFPGLRGTHVVIKACGQTVAPSLRQTGRGSVSECVWVCVLLCWSKHKLLLPGDRRQRRSIASPFPKTICALDFTSRPRRWVIRWLYPPRHGVLFSCYWHSDICRAGGKTPHSLSFSLFPPSPRRRVTCALRRAAHGLSPNETSISGARSARICQWLKWSLWCCIVYSDRRIRSFDNLHRLEPMWVIGTSVLEFLSSSPLSVFLLSLACLFWLFCISLSAIMVMFIFYIR